MKLLLFLSLLLCIHPSTSFAVSSSLCPGQDGYFYTNYRIRNPSSGGFVSFTAFVEESGDDIYIGKTAGICDLSYVEGDVKISGKVVLRKNAYISGNNIRISGNIVLTGNVTIGSNTTIRGTGVLNEGVYENQTIFLKDELSQNRIPNLLTVNTPIYHRDAYNDGMPSKYWKVTKITKLNEIPDSRKAGCVFDIELETSLKDSFCPSGHNQNYIKYSFKLDFGKEIDRSMITGNTPGHLGVKITIKDSVINPSFSAAGNARTYDGCRYHTYSWEETVNYYTRSGIPLAYFRTTEEAKTFESKLKSAISNCK